MGESSALSEVTWCFIPGTPSEEVGVKETLSDYYSDKLLDSPFKLNFLVKQNHKL